MVKSDFAAALPGELGGYALFDKDDDHSLGYLEVDEDGHIRYFLWKVTCEISIRSTSSVTRSMHSIISVGLVTIMLNYTFEERITTIPVDDVGMIVSITMIVLGFQPHS